MKIALPRMPSLAVSLIASALLFVSSVACLAIRPHLDLMVPLWSALLLITFSMIVISFLKFFS
ncbi:MAG TPA: hypothetical protein VLY86_04855, partial [Methanothrix sp.]|nr:hypothetical protein [Methanothrix sp.]